MSTNSELPKQDKVPGLITDDGSKVDPKYFNDYLINYREGLWLSIRQKENGVWQFIAFFAGAIVIAAGILKGNETTQPLSYVTLGIMSLIISLVSFWGIAIILDANYWENRNLWIHSNIEWKLLGKQEIGKIIPIYYANPNFNYSRMYSQHLYLLLIILNVILAGNIVFLKNSSLYSNQIELMTGALGLLISFVVYYVNNIDHVLVEKYLSTRADMVGDRINFRNYYSFYRYKNIVNSPLLVGSFTLSVVNLYFAIYMLPAMGVKISSIIYYLLSIFLVILLTSVFLVKTITGKFIKEGDEFINKGENEENLLGRKNIKALATSALALSRVLIIINCISIMIWMIISALAYLNL